MMYEIEMRSFTLATIEIDLLCTPVFVTETRTDQSNPSVGEGSDLWTERFGLIGANFVISDIETI